MMHDSQSARWIDGALIALIGAAILGRAGHVLLSWDYFALHPDEALRLDLGGIDWRFAAIGALIGLWVGARLRRFAFNQALAWCAPLVGVIGVAVWWMCAGAGCAAGSEVDTLARYPALIAAELPDRYGIAAPRWNTPLMGVVGSLIALIVGLIALRRRWGARGFWLALALMALIMLIIGAFRPIAMTERMLDGAIAVASSIMALINRPARQPTAHTCCVGGGNFSR
jgi:prolipoprotein diacylglyceryltransferase